MRSNGHRSTAATGLLTALAFIAVAAEECDGLGLREVTRIDERDSSHGIASSNASCILLVNIRFPYNQSHNNREFDPEKQRAGENLWFLRLSYFAKMLAVENLVNLGKGTALCTSLRVLQLV